MNNSQEQPDYTLDRETKIVLLKALMNGKFTPSDIDYLRIRFDIACIVNIKFRDMSEKRGHDTDIEDKIKISYVDGDDE